MNYVEFYETVLSLKKGKAQYIINKIVEFNSSEKIVRVIDAGESYQSIRSIDYVTKRFLHEGGFKKYFADQSVESDSLKRRDTAKQNKAIAKQIISWSFSLIAAAASVVLILKAFKII